MPPAAQVPGPGLASHAVAAAVIALRCCCNTSVHAMRSAAGAAGKSSDSDKKHSRHPDQSHDDRTVDNNVGPEPKLALANQSSVDGNTMLAVMNVG